MKHVLLFLAFGLLYSCAPKVTTTIQKSLAPLAATEEVKVISITDRAPSDAQYLGTVKIDDNGFSTNCKWDVIIAKAQAEARKVGGNALKILDHYPPVAMGSSCDRIVARILKVDPASTAAAPLSDPSASYATLNLYRPKGAGALIGYDVYFGDSLICRMKYNSAEQVRIYKKGLNTLSAKTEVTAELPVDIEFGREYFIRCTIQPGVMVGRPLLQVVDEEIGKGQFNVIYKRK